MFKPHFSVLCKKINLKPPQMFLQSLFGNLSLGVKLLSLLRDHTVGPYSSSVR